MRPETLIPDCPYCDCPLDGLTINGLHAKCNEELSGEMADWEEVSMKFSGVLNWEDSDGRCGTIGEFRDINAPDKVEAMKIVLDEFWDHRLDSASCAPVIVFAE